MRKEENKNDNENDNQYVGHQKDSGYHHRRHRHRRHRVVIHVSVTLPIGKCIFVRQKEKKYKI